MGFLKERRYQKMADGMLDAMQAAALAHLPLQRRILAAFGTEELEWEHDGRRVRARPTGQLYGEQAPDLVLIGLARFIDSATGDDLWEYPARVFAGAPRFVASNLVMPSLEELLAES